MFTFYIYENKTIAYLVVEIFGLCASRKNELNQCQHLLQKPMLTKPRPKLWWYFEMHQVEMWKVTNPYVHPLGITSDKNQPRVFSLLCIKTIFINNMASLLRSRRLTSTNKFLNVASSQTLRVNHLIYFTAKSLHLTRFLPFFFFFFISQHLYYKDVLRNMVVMVTTMNMTTIIMVVDNLLTPLGDQAVNDNLYLEIL